MNNVAEKVLIVSHDAGGAEVVSSWVRHHSRYHYLFVLDGPAKKIFTQKIVGLKNNPEKNLISLIKKCDWVLTGTSWASDLEKNAIRLAKEYGIRVAGYLDHWCNYKERFMIEGSLILPDEIWVGDGEAFKIAIALFPREKIKLEPNRYFIDLREEMARMVLSDKCSDKLKILYVCEPMEEHALKEYGNKRYWGYTEFDALDHFFKILVKKSVKDSDVEAIRIRLHPSESKNKYDHYLKKYIQWPIRIQKNGLLLGDCNWADWIVGCSSMALVVGILSDKKAFSCFPKGAQSWRLPFESIKDFDNVELFTSKREKDHE
jgi:hypothetical protein